MGVERGLYGLKDDSVLEAGRIQYSPGIERRSRGPLGANNVKAHQARTMLPQPRISLDMAKSLIPATYYKYSNSIMEHVLFKEESLLPIREW